jgi:hypothetical protein
MTRSRAPRRRRSTWKDFAADIARRRADYEAKYGHPPEPPRNSGKRRTASKRALLKAIEEAGGIW